MTGKSGQMLTDDAAVVSQVPVQDGQANVEKNAMGALVQQKPAKHLQTVCVDIELVKMVQTRVSADFQFLTRERRSDGQNCLPSEWYTIIIMLVLAF
jgi:hypothetical protein